MKSKSFQQQTKEFQAHRQFHRLFFKENDMDFAFQWLMGSAVHGGAGIGEGFYTASKIKNRNPQSWEIEWNAMAQRVEERAKKAFAAGHKISARDFFLRAAVYYRAILGSLRPSDENFTTAIGKMRNCFQNGGALLNPPLERVEIIFEGVRLPGYFLKAQANDDPQKTLLMVGGGETFAEDLYYYIAPAALKRGYNFFTIDFPGQGDLPLSKMFFRSDFETPMKAVVDYLYTRKDVDQRCLAAYGISAGGYIVPRAVSYEPRINACIANSMIPNMFDVFSNSQIPKIKGLVRWYAEQRTPFLIRMLELICWRWGLDHLDVDRLIEVNRDLVFEPEKILCPTLILIGEGEYENLMMRQKQITVLSKLPNSQKKLVIGPVNEGAASHCMGENLGLMSSFVFDWLDDVFCLDN